VIVAQRLVRSVCIDCKVDGDKPAIHQRDSCVSCNGTGYYGRFAVLEIMPITDGLRTLLNKESSPADIWSHAESEGLLSLRHQLELLVCQGVTDQAELQRVLGAA